MQTFQLVRDVDVTGVSGTGVVAEGVEFSDGVVALRWLAVLEAPDEVDGVVDAEGEPVPARRTKVRPTTVLHDDVVSVVALHGHDGRTRLVWAA